MVLIGTGFRFKNKEVAMVIKFLKSSLCALLVMCGSMQAAQSPGTILSEKVIAILKSNDYDPAQIDALFEGGVEKFIEDYKVFFLANADDPTVLPPVHILAEDAASNKIIRRRVFYMLCQNDFINIRISIFGEAYRINVERLIAFNKKMKFLISEVARILGPLIQQDIHGGELAPEMFFVIPKAHIDGDDDSDVSSIREANSDYGDSTDDEGLEGNPL
jgi:hypothetical protein